MSDTKTEPTPRPWSIRLTGGRVEGVPAAVLIDATGAWVASTSEINAKLMLRAIEAYDNRDDIIATLRAKLQDRDVYRRATVRSVSAVDESVPGTGVMKILEPAKRGRLFAILDSFEHRDGDASQIHFRHPDLPAGSYCHLAADGDTLQFCLPMDANRIHVSRVHLSLNDLWRDDWEIVDK